MKRRHQLEPGAAAHEASESALYESAENEEHRKPGAGQGQVSKRRRGQILPNPMRC
ncbi:MAG: hypothetical protein H6948_02140 [Zoogloeaceae bacterium]|nr:hypothetical protein [Zoogloeaceae bacterium]